MKNKFFKDEGMTLIELALTIAIISIIIIFIFSFFQFNYSTFNKSNDRYNIQTSLNNVSRMVEEELQFVTDVKIYKDLMDTEEFNSDKNYIYFEENTEGNAIKIKKIGEDSKTIIGNDLVSITELQFKLKDNLLDFSFKVQSLKNKSVYNIDSAIVLLNFEGNIESKGVVIEYDILEGDD